MKIEDLKILQRFKYANRADEHVMKMDTLVWVLMKVDRGLGVCFAEHDMNGGFRVSFPMGSEVILV
ncbi:MAG: hypothetical protein HRT93_03390 [Piscirickettsiaceae bacterium]|nr:hypothetical protein [Piscirickettsiaceae bacterium]